MRAGPVLRDVVPCNCWVAMCASWALVLECAKQCAQHSASVQCAHSCAVLCCGVQSRDVVVYRLVTCGTVEEKIYRKQVCEHTIP